METFESEKINNNHKYIYTTYNELNKIMPRNYLKIKVLPHQKYSTSNKRIIDIIETKYNPIINSTKKNEKLKKNIYLFSNNNISEKDLLFSKILSKNKNSRNDLEINYSNNNYKIIKTVKNNSIRKNGIFNSSPINNYFLRNNIRLPGITQRMKSKIPRNEREINGFKVIGNEEEEPNKKYMKKNNNMYFIDEKKYEANYNNKCYCLTEKNEKKKKLNRVKNFPSNIISIVNKNKNTKYNFY